MKRITLMIPLLGAALLTGCGGDGDDDDEVASATPAASTPASGAGGSTATASTIDKVAASGGFNALLVAATKAQLAPALADTGASLTVFAPTDAAFTALATRLGFASAAAMVEALPADTLASILRYHILPTNRNAAALTASAQSSQPTLYQFEGQAAPLSVNAGSGGVTITDGALTSANVTSADIAASNGVVHAIDKVLIPPGVLTIAQIARLNPGLSSLTDAVAQAGLGDTLSGSGPFTVFAPVNEAFAQVPAGLSTTQLGTVLRYHVLTSQVLASQIPFGSGVATAAPGQSIVINAGTPPTITDTTGTPARIVATDVRASNGVVHVIDKVLIPAL